MVIHLKLFSPAENNFNKQYLDKNESQLPKHAINSQLHYLLDFKVPIFIKNITLFNVKFD